MAKKSLLLAFILIVVLGLAGVFLVSPNRAQAEVAISGELGSQSQEEVTIITSVDDSVVGDEVLITTLSDSGNGTTTDSEVSDEVSITTLADGGGGGGGGSGGGSRKKATTTAACAYPYLQKFIKFGQVNDRIEVVKLQLFLHQSQGFSNVAITGIYDEPTLAAVMEFQRRYAKDILEPWGLTTEQPTGYVFVTTQLVINRLYCGYTTQHNLNLRHAYDNLPTEVVHKATVDKEAGGATPVAPATTTCPLATTTVVSDSDQAAAVGFLNFLKDNLWFWLIPLLILILILASYYLWQEGTPEEYKDYDDEVYTSRDLPPDSLPVEEEPAVDKSDDKVEKLIAKLDRNKKVK